MLYVGLDIHSKSIVACVLGKNGKVIERKSCRQVDQLMDWLERLARPMQICFEASTGYGQFFETFAKIADRVVVAHPGHLRLIFRAKKKNDRVDAEKLAKLLYLDEVPAVHVPKANVRAWRELITFRRKTIEKRTRAKNAIRALLRTVRVSAPKGSGLWTKAGMAWLSQLAFEQRTHALRRDMLIEEIQQLTAQARRVEVELARFSRKVIRRWPCCGRFRESARERPRRSWRFSTTRVASATAKRWERTSAWSLRKTSRAA